MLCLWIASWAGSQFIDCLLLAILFHEYILLVVYLISYIPLRAYSGGHHATSYGICTIVSTVILIVVCLLKKILPISATCI